ncbi:MAG: ABC transporter permease [Candidatus Didemnitutus sp.]|jgi:putative ABC transport system permease protein|nr:ABC transporter permease [Candidatus Didemnitutus sp.]
MKRLLYEFSESVRIAATQIRANKMRSVLTALGVIIGVVAVTLMGTAIRGIDKGFANSLALLGEDVLYVQKWPWGPVEDWWNYVNRPNLKPEHADKLNRVIESTNNSLLAFAVPVVGRGSVIKVGDAKVSGVFTIGTTAPYAQMTGTEYKEGRLFNETEAESGAQVCVLGYDVAEALLPNRDPIGETVLISGQPFTVVGVFAKQGEFLGLFSFDNQAVIPLKAFQKYFSTRRGAEIRVKVLDQTKLAAAKDELTGAMRRVRAQLPGERDNFSINEQEAFKAQLDPVKGSIATIGFVITGLALFVGAIGIMNITFVSVKERTKEIGTRKALGARRRSILLQFLIEAVSISLIGGLVGLALTMVLVQVAAQAFPSFPVSISFGIVALAVGTSVFAGVAAGFVPALGASRLDPVVALRYE